MEKYLKHARIVLHQLLQTFPVLSTALCLTRRGRLSWRFQKRGKAQLTWNDNGQAHLVSLKTFNFYFYIFVNNDQAAKFMYFYSCSRSYSLIWPTSIANLCWSTSYCMMTFLMNLAVSTLKGSSMSFITRVSVRIFKHVKLSFSIWASRRPE